MSFQVPGPPMAPRSSRWRIWVDWHHTETDDLFPTRGVDAPPRRTAIGFALIAACSAGFVSAMLHQRVGGWSDFSQIALGAQALRHGLNPYLAASTPHTGVPLMYPLPAVLLALPWSWLSMNVASTSFSALGVGVLAYAHARTGPIERPAVVALFSAAIVKAVMYSQWPALMLGALMLSNRVASGMLMACKPTTGIWLWAARPTWQSALGAVCAFAISLVVRPTWPSEWWTAIGLVRAYTVIPGLLPFGFLIVIAAALRWRRPEARLLLAMCCVPHSTLIYETLPLLALIPKTWPEAWLLCAGSWISYLAFAAFIHVHPVSGGDAVRISGLFSLVLIYAPCAIMLLRRSTR